MDQSDARRSFENVSLSIFKDQPRYPIIKMISIRLTSTITIFSLAVSGQVAPAMPNEPYDLTAVLVDYGIIFENAPLIPSNVTSKQMNSTIEALNKPIQEFCKAVQNSATTNATGYQDSLLGMLDLLKGNGTFKVNTISTKNYTAAKISESVIKLTTLEKALKGRNTIYDSMEQPDEAIAQYQTNLKAYQKLVKAASETEIKSLITTEEIDWETWTKRYIKLLQLLRKDKAKIKEVRQYLSKWLHDGDQDDSTYDQLIEKTTTSTTGGNATITSTITKSASTTKASTSTSQSLRIPIGDATANVPSMTILAMTCILAFMLC